jgi:hypothetical protein
MRVHEAGNDACRRLPVLLRMHGLQDGSATAAWRLLRVLLLWLGEMPADPAATQLPRIIRRGQATA